MNGREVLACWEAVEPDDDDRAAAQSSGYPRSGRRPNAATKTRSQAWSRGSSAGSLYAVSRAAHAQADEGCLEGARLHQLHVLLLGLSGDRARRSDRFRRPGPARPAWRRPRSTRATIRRRSSARSRSPAYSIASLATSAKRCARPHSDRQPDHRAAEGQSGAASARAWRDIRRALRDHRRDARPRRSERTGAARTGLAGAANLPRIIRLLLRGKINPLKTLFWHQNRGRRHRPAGFFGGKAAQT